jgi:hypothetical protein
VFGDGIVHFINIPLLYFSRRRSLVAFQLGITLAPQVKKGKEA